MQAIDPLEATGGGTRVVFGANQTEDYEALPAIVFIDPDSTPMRMYGKVLIEWCFTPEERAAIARGENLRHWIWRDLQRPFEPVKLEVTQDLHG